MTRGTIHYGHSFYLDRFRVSVQPSPVVFQGKEDFDSLCHFLGDTHMDPRPVVFDDAQDVSLGKNPSDPFPSDLDPLDLHVIFRADKVPSSWASALRGYKTVEYKSPRPFGKDYENFLQEEATRLKIRFEEKHLPIIVSFVGEDLYRLSSEVRKLSYIVPAGSTVSSEVLKFSLVSSGSVAYPAVGEAFLKKDAKSFFTLLSRLLGSSTAGGDAVLPFLSYLLKHLDKMIQAISMRKQGLSQDEVASRLGMNPWRYKNHFHGYLSQFTLPSLLALYAALVEVEYRVRTGRPYRSFLDVSLLEVLVGDV